VKSNPGKVNYPSPGMGTLYHLAGEMFRLDGRDQHAARSLPRRFRALTEVLSGRMELLIDALTNSYPRSRREVPPARRELARALALAAAVPTVADSVPGYEASSFTGVGGPAGMPPAVVERLNARCGACSRSPK